MTKPTILFVTDLYYQAQQRNYAEEDIYVTSKLRESFDLIMCHPQDTESFENYVDVIVCRNTGPVIHYQKIYDEFRNRLLENNNIVYNSLNGQADMQGKQYLLDLTKNHFPVIPTVDDLADIHLLPEVDEYVLKPKQGADSIGLEFVDHADIANLELAKDLLQPKINFSYEVSFYYIDTDIQYALYAPDNEKRWRLELYDYSSHDLDFANQFIRWNSLEHGIQRVDACRTIDGELLLVELEDLNPYLSLMDIDVELRHRFISNFRSSLMKAIEKNHLDS